MSGAEELRVAVASNFKPVMEALAHDFESATGHQVSASYGSTGKHYAQILNGAPFDAFLAADAERPALLEANGISVPGSRFTYAIGQLVLWAPGRSLREDGQGVLEAGEFRFLAIANPVTAPYGRAADQVLRRLGLIGALQGRIVRGENVGQTFAFVQTGNAELGFLAMSQVIDDDSGEPWVVPEALYEPIEQQAVLLNEREAARAFLAFLRDEAALEVIRKMGYQTP